MLIHEYIFNGTVAELISCINTHAFMVRLRTIPGPYTAIDTFTREIPSEEGFPDTPIYAKIRFNSRFTQFNGYIIGTTLPNGNTLMIVDFPHNSYESEYAKQSLQWVWKNLESFLNRYGWLQDNTKPVNLNELNLDQDLSNLRRLMTKTLSNDELQDIVFDLQETLGINYSQLSGDNHGAKTRSLLERVSQRRQLNILIDHLQSYYPHIFDR